MSSNFVRGFEEDDEEHFQSSTILTYSSIDSHCNNINNNPTRDDRSSSHVVSKKKRNLPGNPDPEAEVVALSPRTLMATNRYICEVCHKGFQRDQNLQLHRRGHNLPWKLKQRAQTASSQANKKRVYVCPEPSCVHHDPRRALGDLTGIKKHYCRKHGEKKWKCDKCSKRYAVQSDWKAHAKICGSREYRCDCGTVFSRKDSFVTHRAFCDAITDENYRKNHNITASSSEPVITTNQAQASFSSRPAGSDPDPNPNPHGLAGLSSHDQQHHSFKQFMSLNSHGILIPNSTADIQNHHPYYNNARNSMTTSSSNLGFNGFSLTSSSATALLQKAAEMGSKVSDSITPIILRGLAGYNNNNNNTNSNSNNNNGNKASDLVDLDNLRGGGGGGLSASGFNGLVMSDDDGCGSNNFGFFMGSDRISNNPRTGLYDLHGTSRKGLFVGENEKMTVDFLGMDSNAAGNYHSDEWNSWRRD